MSTFDTRFKSKGVEYTTPDKLFQPLNDEFNFKLDAASSPQNKKCSLFYTEYDDGLACPWVTSTWCNPPYGQQLPKWARKGYTEHHERGITVVMLLPIRSNTKYWRDYIHYGKAEIRFVDWKPAFNGENGFSTPLAVIVWQ